MNDDTFDQDQHESSMYEHLRDDDAMSQPEDVRDEIEVLQAVVEAEPGSAAFPRLAEAYRRDGQVERAVAIARAGLALAPERMGGRVALALALMDRGENTQAIQELSCIMENVPEVLSDISETAVTPAVETIETLMDDDAASDDESADTSEEESDASVGDEFPVLVEAPAETSIEAAPEPAPEAQDHVTDATDDDVSETEHRLYAVPLASPSAVLPELDEQRSEVASDSELREDEIDEAFAQAEPDVVVTPNQVAQAAILDTVEHVDAVEEVDEPEEVEEPAATHPAAAPVDFGEEYRASERPVFATETMANLLEGQGDTEAADRIRASLSVSSSIDSSGSSAMSSQAEYELEAVGQTSIEHEVTPLVPFAGSDELVLDEAPSHMDEEAAVACSDEEFDAAPEISHLPVEAASVDDALSGESQATQSRAARNDRIIGRLETWLANIRREVA